MPERHLGVAAQRLHKPDVRLAPEPPAASTSAVQLRRPMRQSAFRLAKGQEENAHVKSWSISFQENGGCSYSRRLQSWGSRWIRKRPTTLRHKRGGPPEWAPSHPQP